MATIDINNRYNIGDLVRVHPGDNADNGDPNHPMIITGMLIRLNYYGEPYYTYDTNDACWGTQRDWDEEDLVPAGDLLKGEEWYLRRWQSILNPTPEQEEEGAPAPSTASTAGWRLTASDARIKLRQLYPIVEPCASP